jgi:phosphatidate phosphatase APP1
LVSSLNTAREKIASDIDDTISHSESFEKLYNSIVG